MTLLEPTSVTAQLHTIALSWALAIIRANYRHKNIVLARATNVLMPNGLHSGHKGVYDEGSSS